MSPHATTQVTVRLASAIDEPQTRADGTPRRVGRG